MIDLKDWFPEFFTSIHPVPPSYMRHVDPEVLDPRIEDIFRERGVIPVEILQGHSNPEKLCEKLKNEIILAHKLKWGPYEE